MAHSALLALAGLLLALPASTSARTWYITPDGTGDAPTIAYAVVAAADGDVIVLADGVFTGSGNHAVSYLGKAITIRSESGDATSCVIDAEGQTRAFRFVSGEGPDSRLAHVSIVNTRPEGIRIVGSSRPSWGVSSPRSLQADPVSWTPAASTRRTVTLRSRTASSGPVTDTGFIWTRRAEA